MGYYIQAPSNKGKAAWLVANHGAEVIEDPEWSDDFAIICVVDNGMFEAVGYCYHPRELEAFKRPDSGFQRPRIWLKMDKKLAEKLSGYCR